MAKWQFSAEKKSQRGSQLKLLLLTLPIDWEMRASVLEGESGWHDMSSTVGEQSLAQSRSPRYQPGIHSYVLRNHVSLYQNHLWNPMISLPFYFLRKKRQESFQVSATVLVFKSEMAGRWLCGLSLGGTQALRLKRHDAHKNENPQD